MSSSKVQRGYLVELVLCTVVAAMLVYTVQGGFKIAPAIHSAWPATFGVSLLAQGICFAGVHKPRSRVVVAVVYAVLSVLACAVALSLSAADDVLADVPENYLVAVLVYVLVNLLVFLLSRKHKTSIVLLAVGVFLCALMQFLFEKNMFVPMVVFLLTGLALVVFKNYQISTRTASTLDELAYGGALGVGVAIPLVACAVASLVTFALVMPLHPPAAKLKLVTEKVALEEVEVAGVAELADDSDRVLKSSRASGETRTTTDLKKDESASRSTSDSSAGAGWLEDLKSGKYTNVDLNALGDRVQTLSFDRAVPWVLLVAGLLVAAVVAAVVVKKLVRRRWFVRACGAPAREQPLLFYEFFLKRLGRMGLEKPEHATPTEFAAASASRLSAFDNTYEHVGFGDVTNVLVATEYGGIEPAEDALETIRCFYRTFYHNCRKQIGSLRYLFKYFIL